MNNPLISIITVTYNAEKFLERTIESIGAQTYKNIEYIIVDGNSKDQTVPIIKKHEDIVTKWISEPDKGLYDAMNKGLTMAKGEYVWFINAGDEIYQASTLNTIFGKENQLADIYYGETMVVDEMGKEIGLRRLKPKKPLTWKSFRWGQLVSHQSFIARIAICPLYHLEYAYSADTDWQIKTMRKATTIKNTNLILSKFLEGGRSKKTIIPSLKERFDIMIRNYGIISTLIIHLVMVPRFLLYYATKRRF